MIIRQRARNIPKRPDAGIRPRISPHAARVSARVLRDAGRGGRRLGHLRPLGRVSGGGRRDRPPCHRLRRPIRPTGAGRMAIRRSRAALAQCPRSGPGHRRRPHRVFRADCARLDRDPAWRAGGPGGRRRARGAAHRRPAFRDASARIHAARGEPQLSCTPVPGLALLLAAAAAAPHFRLQALAVEGDVASVVAADLDGDGRKDLVAVYKIGVPPYQKRSFAIFWNRDGVFAPRPDLTLAVDEAEACAFDVGAVGPGPAEDLLLVTPRGVNAKSFPGRVGAPPRKLVEHVTLFHQPINGELPRVRLIHDLAGPNSRDLLLPSLGSLAIYRRIEDRYEKTAEVEVDMEVSGGPKRNAGIEVRYGFPALHVLDTDGDGLRDVIAIQEDRIAIYRQGPGFTFRPQPDFSRDFSVRTPSARNTSYVFFGRKDGFSQKPAEILQSERFVLLQTQIIDLTGDGRPDLVVPTTSFGVFALIRMLTAKTAKVNFQIFPFDRK